MLRFSRSPDPAAENKPRIVDGAAAKVWLAGMPQPGSVANLLEIAEVLHALGATGEVNGAAGLHPYRKYAIAERIRGVLLHVLAERGREDNFAALPLSDTFGLQFWPAVDAASALRDLYAWLVSQLPEKPAAIDGAGGDGTAESAPSAVFVSRVHALQRALDVNAQAMLLVQRARWPVPAPLWERHCTLGQLVRDLDCQDDEVADVLRASATRTCRAAFVLPVMIALADPAARTIGEFDLIRMAAQRWSTKVGFRIERRNDSAQAPVRPVSNPGPTIVLGNCLLRFDMQNTIQSIDRRLEALAEGRSPREVGIGDGLRAPAALELLTMLRQRWGAVAPQNVDAPDRLWRLASTDGPAQQVLAFVGMPTRDGALRDKEKPGPRTQSAYDYQRIDHGAIAKPREDIDRDRATQLFAHAETWTVVAEAADALRCLRKHARPRLGLQRLIGFKLGDRDGGGDPGAGTFLLGWVEALQGTTVEDDDRRVRALGAHTVRVRLAPGLPVVIRATIDDVDLDCAFLLAPASGDVPPRARAMRSPTFVPLQSDSGLKSNLSRQEKDAWQPVRASPREYGLVLPHASFRPQRLVKVVSEGSLAVLRLEELMMRGADFDLVRFTLL